MLLELLELLVLLLLLTLPELLDDLLSRRLASESLLFEVVSLEASEPSCEEPEASPTGAKAGVAGALSWLEAAASQASSGMASSWSSSNSKCLGVGLAWRALVLS